MANVYGLTPTGFVIPSVDDIRSEIESLLRLTFGASLPLGDNTLLGFMVGIVSERIALLWEFARASWAALDPDSATGIALEALALLSGTFRIAAAASAVKETLCGDDGTVIGSGTTVATSSTGARFTTTVPVTITLLPVWASTHAYIVGDRVSNGSKCYQCTVAGTSAGSGGPVVTTGTTTDGSVTWAWIGTGVAAVDVAMISVDKDQIVAVAGDLTDIVNPIGGLTTAFNLLDATVGNVVQSDQGLRLLRDAELASAGSSTPDAIRAKLLRIADVTNAFVFYNPTDTTDANGITPHAIKALVQGGTDENIFVVLAANVGAGIGTMGTTTGTVKDSAGHDQTYNFQRPTVVDVYWRMTLTKDPKTYIGDDELKTLLATTANQRVIGTDAVASSINAIAFTATGPLDATSLIYTDVIGTPVAWTALTGYVATVGARSVVTNDGGRTYICITAGTSAASGGPTGVAADITDGTAHWAFLGNTIAIDSLSLAVYDTTRITIVATDGTP